MKIRQNTLKRLFAIENNNPSGKWKGKEKDMVLSVFNRENTDGNGY